MARTIKKVSVSFSFVLCIIRLHARLKNIQIDHVLLYIMNRLFEIYILTPWTPYITPRYATYQISYTEASEICALALSYLII